MSRTGYLTRVLHKLVGAVDVNFLCIDICSVVHSYITLHGSWHMQAGMHPGFLNAHLGCMSPPASPAPLLIGVAELPEPRLSRPPGAPLHHPPRNHLGKYACAAARRGKVATREMQIAQLQDSSHGVM